MKTGIIFNILKKYNAEIINGSLSRKKDPSADKQNFNQGIIHKLFKELIENTKKENVLGEIKEATNSHVFNPKIFSKKEKADINRECDAKIGISNN